MSLLCSITPSNRSPDTGMTVSTTLHNSLDLNSPSRTWLLDSLSTKRSRTRSEDDEEHDEMPPTTSSRHSPRWKRGTKVSLWRRSTWIPFVFGLLSGVGIFFLSDRVSTSSYSSLIPYWFSRPKLTTPNRIFIREHANEEGIGSALQRLKGGIIIATKVLDSTWLVGETVSDHQYYHDDVLNPAVFKEGSIEWPEGRICRLSDYLPRKDRQMIIRGVCSGKGEGFRLAMELKRKMDDRNCRIILEDIKDEVIEDLNACYRGFVRERLGASEGRRLEKDPRADSKALSIGIHIRWGDAAMYEGTMEAPRGSMQLVHINRIISNVRNKFARLDIRVVMERANSTVLDLLDFNDYALVDSGDSFADLHQLGDNDLLLLGTSSYSALSHIVAPSRGLSIIEGFDIPRKYADSDYRPVVLNSGQGIDYLSMLEELFPQVERT